MIPIVGLVSSYREGELAHLAVRGLLECCNVVLVLEGAIGDKERGGEPSVFWRGRKPPAGVVVRRGGPWRSDAEKRTELLEWAQQRHPGPAWGIVVDGDEELLFGYALPAYLARAVAEDAAGTMKLVVCEADGQVFESGARCLPLHLIGRYVLSSHVLEMRDSAVAVTLPLLPAQKPPIMGQPHILHRAYLRPPGRNANENRLSSDELRDLRVLGVKV